MGLWGETKNKLIAGWGWLKGRSNAIWEYLNDDEFLLGLLLVAFAAVLHFGCLEPWAAVKWLALVLGVKRLYDILKY